jgi:hypothetical protein
VARSILLAGTLLWLAAGVLALGTAALATEAIERALPPLAIDTEALRGTVVALGVALLALGLVHAAALVGLDRRTRWGSTVAILLAGFLAATLLVLAVAAATSAVTVPSMAALLVGAFAASAVGAVAYAAAVVGLVRRRRSESAF